MHKSDRVFHTWLAFWTFEVPLPISTSIDGILSNKRWFIIRIARKSHCGSKSGHFTRNNGPVQFATDNGVVSIVHFGAQL